MQELAVISHNPTSITPEEYFDVKFDLTGRDIGRPIEQTTKTQKFRAQLWLCEQYPLSLPEQLVPIIDLMAATNAHFRKLKDFITLQLPSGFPVKIGEFMKSSAFRLGFRNFVVIYRRPCCSFLVVIVQIKGDFAIYLGFNI